MILYQKWITREDLRANRDVLYLFGDNLQRRGLGGQAKEMRGEPNAVGVPTKAAPGRGSFDYFSDVQLDDNILAIEEALEPVFAHVQSGGTVVVPLDGLGTGLAKLESFAPDTLNHLEKRLRDLALTRPLC